MAASAPAVTLDSLGRGLRTVPQARPKVSGALPTFLRSLWHNLVVARSSLVVPRSHGRVGPKVSAAILDSERQICDLNLEDYH